MANRPMSDKELRTRKKVQAVASRASGTLGLASVGAFGASKLPGAKFMTKTPKLRRIASSFDAKKAENIALGTSTTGAGIGGASSFNFASYTSAEAKKKKQPVRKNSSISAFGVDHAETGWTSPTD